ncbi:pumilio/PUF RNA binding protein 2 [Trypanosoma grayi]|uniref:pumilio/PUF RNA binding protein 2 n=1 Tax=Trypanosoma grayi TaxID=71804 RepID=UPI0004F4A516|nr:pumilio/PUF RNA binding protein 2 [Trypanosoma grayi]KEG10770.1 pumilio/PUF RNA binding protein 2 [Trypanosoma grayi]
MSTWGNIGSSAPGEGCNDSKAKDAVEVDWFSNGHDIFSGGADTLLVVDPRDVRRAETAPSVLTIFSADGRLCVGGSLEEEVPPEEEYRYTEEYHMLYYSKYPRDPRMLVPLRNRGATKRGGETGLPGRGISAANKEHQEGDGTVTASTASNIIMNVDDVDESSQEAKEKGAAFAQSLLDSLSKKQQEEQQPHSSGMETCQTSSHLPADSVSTNTTPCGSYLQPNAGSGTSSNCAAHQQDDLAVQSMRQVGSASRRPPGGGNRSFPNAGSKKNARRQMKGGDAVSSRLARDEFTPMREYLEGVRSECTYNDIKGHIVALSKDQDGSRFVQRLLDEEENVESIFNEVLPNTHELMIDVFGNYVLQKLLDVLSVGSDESKQLLAQVSGRLKEYSFQMYGCRVMQKFLERASLETREEILLELKDSLVDCVFDQNANHVAQKIIEVMPEKTQFVTEAFMSRLKSLSRHPYGCRVLQCVFEKCSPVPEVNIRPLLEAVLDHVHEYVMDQYGNYVVQHALLNAPEDLRQRFVDLLIPHVYALSCSKFASNVAEKTIVKANEEELQRIVETLTRPLGGTEDGNYLILMMQDPYANYVVQRLLQQVNKQQQQHIAEQTRPHIMSIRRSVYGQHLVQKMESMGIFSWVDGDVYNNSTSNTNSTTNYYYRDSSTAGRGGGKKSRGGVGGRGGERGRSSAGSNSLTPGKRPLTAGAPYQQATAAVAVAGRNVLPLATAGSGYGYSYLASPSDPIMAPPQQHPMAAPSLTIGGRTCYPSMMPPPQQQQQQQQQPQQQQQQQQQQRQPFALQSRHDPYTSAEMVTTQPQQIPQAGDVYATNTFYANGNGLMTHTQNDGWTQSYHAFGPSVQQTMLYSGNTSPNVYPSMNAAFEQGRYNPISSTPPVQMQQQ